MSVLDFNSILVSNAEFLKPFAITLTKDSEAAQDLFQETLYRALANREKYNVGTNIKAWLYTIMRNIFINNYRRKSLHKVTPVSSISDVMLTSFPETNSINGYTHIHLKEIYQALSSLPDIFKNPFQLYYEGYKYQEIAEMLNEPLGTIKSRIHFARKLLKSHISRQ